MYVMKAYKANGGELPLILNLSSRWVQMINVKRWPLYIRRKDLPVTLNRKLVGHRSRFWHSDKTNLLSLLVFEPLIT